MDAQCWFDASEHTPPFGELFWGAYASENVSGNAVVRLTIHDNYGWHDVAIRFDSDTIDRNKLLAWRHVEKPAPPTKKVVWQ